MLAKLAEIVNEQNPRADATAADGDKTLEELGLDSLDIATVMMNIEEHFGVKLSEAEITGETTLTQLGEMTTKS